MTRLLVSVRDAAEAHIALEAGVHLIDVKEPSRGSLGAADAGQIAEVLEAVTGHVPVSAAFGELFFEPPSGRTCPGGLAFAKWGLAGASDQRNWMDQWARAIHALPPQTRPVAILYADWHTARSPAPRELLIACREHRVDVLLVDTFDKSQGGLLDVWPLIELEQLVHAARDLGLMIVIGGSLTIETLPRVLPLAPDYIAVRGAACTGGRDGPIDPQRVRALLAAINETTNDARAAVRHLPVASAVG
jgi:uncharacterized protein (UPF0264 family)